MMKLLIAREHARTFRLVVQLDDSQPATGDNLAEFVYDKTPPQGQTRAQYLVNIKRETKSLCALRLAQQDEGTPLTGEGDTL